MSQTQLQDQITKSFKGFSPEMFATTLRADFRFAPINVMIMVVIFVIGLAVHLNLNEFSYYAVAICLGSAIVFPLILRVFQVWETAIALGTLAGLVAFLHMRPDSEVLLVTIVLAMLMAPSVQMAYQWEKAVVLRFGKFRANSFAQHNSRGE